MWFSLGAVISTEALLVVVLGHRFIRSTETGSISQGKSLSKEQTETIKLRTNRISRGYDLMEAIVEKLAFSRWRRRVFDSLIGHRILEVGVGTAKNFDFYPRDKSITAIDFSPAMLRSARKKLKKTELKVDLHEMDLQHLQFPDHSYDTVLTTFVFCSVPDPMKGVREIGRVSKKGGRIIFLEHVRPGNRVLGKLFDSSNWPTLRMIGVNINRDTLANIEGAGLKIVSEINLFSHIVKLITAKN
jgi:ubiquinone/menaquinone biosynthesis C-methylase UbiE